MKKLLLAGMLSLGAFSLAGCKDKNKQNDENKPEEKVYSKEETIAKLKESVNNVKDKDVTLDIDGDVKLKINAPTNGDLSGVEGAEILAMLNDIRIVIDGYTSIDYETGNSYSEFLTTTSVMGNPVVQTTKTNSINQGSVVYNYKSTTSGNTTEKELEIEYKDVEENNTNNDFNIDDINITGKSVGETTTITFNIEENKQLFESLGGNDMVGGYAPGVDLTKESYTGDVVLTIIDKKIDKLELKNFQTSSTVTEGITATIKADMIIKYNEGLRTIPAVPADKESYTLTSTPIEGIYTYTLNNEAYEIEFNGDEFLIYNSLYETLFSGTFTTNTNITLTKKITE